MAEGEIVGTGIAKAYPQPGRGPLQVLQDCSFRFEAARLNVVMGTSGCAHQS